MKRVSTIIAGSLLAALAAVVVPAQARAEDKPDGRVFELRTYTANEGKLEALHKRFREHTNKIFAKHGMEMIGYWTPTDGEQASNTLVYILAFPSQEARDKAWAAFRDDPEWHAARDASEANGRLVKEVKSQMLRPTDYSPIN